MSWKQATIVRILMLVAKMYAEEDGLKKEIQDLANHLSVVSHREGKV